MLSLRSSFNTIATGLISQLLAKAHKQPTEKAKSAARGPRCLSIVICLVQVDEKKTEKRVAKRPTPGEK
jgi:hypothetical protein